MTPETAQSSSTQSTNDAPDSPPSPPADASDSPAALEATARALAHFDLQHLRRRPLRAKRHNDLLARLETNRRQLVANYRATVHAAESGGWISPAGEWLLDNFHVIAEQIREGREDLPPAFYRGLPELTDGDHAGRPRAFALAVELIKATDGLLDIDALERFLAAYQTVAPLTIGELWAIPIALRHAFLDRLAVIAARVDRARVEREAAAKLADELAAAAQKGTSAKVAETLEARVSQRVAPSTTMFATELASRLRDRHPALALATAWLERTITAQGLTLEQAISAEHKSQAQNQLSVGNCITSMRTITATDWRQVFEQLSVVERVLRTDPAGAYAGMDFATRDRYRHVVERLGTRTARTEREIAESAIALAQGSTDPRRSHVGYYLIDSGIGELEGATQVTPRLRVRVRRAINRYRTLAYLSPIVVGSALIAGAFAHFAAHFFPTAHTPVLHAAIVIALGLLALFPASELMTSLVNLVTTLTRPPTPLPKMDFSAGIAPEFATLVAVPMMLGSVASIEAQVEQLEIAYLGNQDPRLRFALVSDFLDAKTEESAEDVERVAAAQAGIARLNAQHATAGRARFFLFHRRRVWAESEQRFIGWERKRGKLTELNRFLLGQSTPTLELLVGDRSELEGVTRVLTLDADTQLPLGSAARMVGAMAHPLNQARVNEAGVVTDGYTVLQPRISVSPESATQTRFARLYADRDGIDPYTSAVSDVYQDVFEEGSFVGKGLYDVRSFEAAVHGAIPEGTVLSHDLLEGLLARAALLSDVELFDDTPSNYLSASARRHRWIRGDWQITPWLGRSVPQKEGRRPNPLSSISRWKIVDNLRRSLVAPAELALLVCGWVTIASPLLWTCAVALLVALPIFAHATAAAVRRPEHAGWTLHLGHVLADAGRALLRAGLAAVMLPYEAWVNVDAIVRALYRQHISKRRLLEWVPAQQSEGGAPRTMARFYAAMGPASLLALALVGVAVLRLDWRAFYLLPLAGAWALAPALARWLSLPERPADATQLTAVAHYFLRRTARKTWRYFATFVTADDHFLPPDNFQDSPRPLLAHRTSPTNIGLSLAANLSALDLGYIGRLECVERIEAALDTMEKLERFRGHFVNWYDTKTLAPLLPRYVSTVDSGNLAALLMTVQQGCLALPAVPTTLIVDGLVDTLRQADEEIDRLPDGAPTLRSQIAAFEALLSQPPPDLQARGEWLDRLHAALDSLEGEAAGLAASADHANGADQAAEVAYWCGALRAQVESHRRDGGNPELTSRLTAIAARTERLVTEMDFRFLYHPGRQVFAIGFDVAAERLDRSFYDLLASESRLGSFVAIAKGDVPVKHWFRLGRPLTRVGRRRALLSWTGTMFEYLMPSLLMKSFRGTLLTESLYGVVERQIAYGKQRRVPWGISESAYNARDLSLNYQYGPFGCPGLGIKRGLAEDLVVAPYATALALLVEPKAAVENLWRLQGEGLDAQYGFCESIDYTPSRVPDGQRGVVVRTFMAHHQGMSLLAIGELLAGQRMTGRFHADPRVKAAELLLQESVPYAAPVDVPPEDMARRPRPARVVTNEEWVPFDVNAAPQVHLLSNGSYSVMVTAAGGGYSKWRDLAVTRWREDPTRDSWGQFIYVRELHDQKVWSASHQPTLVPAPGADLCFSPGQAEFRRVDDEIETHLVVSVATEDDAEVRTIKLTNQSHRVRELEVTSYAEVVLMSPAADAAHPAFAKLFVETVEVDGALLATRRPRANGESCPTAVHVSTVEGQSVGAVSFETDRARFLGRGRSTIAPAAATEQLSGTTGAVLDPIFSLRRRVRIEPGKSVRVVFTTGVTDTREQALALAHKYSEHGPADRAAQLAWVQAQSQLHYLGLRAEDARLYRRLAGRVLFAQAGMRAKPEVIANNRRGQSGLWAYGISGDWPIVLLRIEGDEHVELLRELLHAHEFMRMRGLSFDLVIINEHPPSYLQSFHDQIMGVVRSGPGASLVDKPTGIFVRRADLLPPEDQALLASVARVIVRGGRGGLAEQLDAAPEAPAMPPTLALRTPTAQPDATITTVAPVGGNGLGSFSPDGKEYVIRLAPGQTTPAPWVNVLANAQFGSIVSEVGAGYEWADNSHENRLTEWRNDPVTDLPTSCVYIRDESDGNYFTATPLPTGKSAFTITHGQGYSRFSGQTFGLAHELTILVAADDPVRLQRLTLTNKSDRRRQLSLFSYVEWTLGVLRDSAAPMVVTSLDGETGALLARNTYPNDLGSRVAFCDATPRFATCSGDRAEFLGHNGDPARPAALSRVGLSGRVGAAYDPCGALHLPLVLAPGESVEIQLVMGQTGDEGSARALITRYRQPGAVTRALSVVSERWDDLLGAITIATPDQPLDQLVNRWLLYQVTASRLWARTSLYQSGGAFGFRDQLQDVASLLYAKPALAKEQILRAAGQQFVEGDVLHWWHPPTGRGVRTRFADDYLWLPFIAAHYVQVTGDQSILDEQVSFIEARALAPEEHEAYLAPTPSGQTASLYEHLARAADRSFAVGAHGLPLMGCGDWNDGMNRVGIGGQGESVWMAWFLIATLEALAPLSEARGETDRARRYRAHVTALKQAVEANAWDGQWYRRAYFDDGTPLGSANAEANGGECKIDSLSQSWSVISGAGDHERAQTAMRSVDKELVDRDAHLIKVLAPPFDKTPHDPGYIKGYVPGVRENGGQYTHAAAWVILAETLLGHGDRAGELLDLINPVRLSATPADVARYRVEPYVITADIAATGPLTGRGGWSWYTGSASWVYRVVVEALLGFTLRGNQLTLNPTIPSAWDGFTMDYRRGKTLYRISVKNPTHVQQGVAELTCDGKRVSAIDVVDDGKTHTVELRMGAQVSVSAAS